MTLPKEVRYQSVRWILAKKSTIEKEAKRHHVSVKAIKNWITRYKKEHGQAYNPKLLQPRGEPIRSDIAPKVAVPVSTPHRMDAGGNEEAFGRAIESAGAASDPSEDPAPIPEAGEVPPDIDPGEPGPPPPEVKPEDLIAFAEMVVTEIPYGFAMLKGVEIPRESLAFTDDEKKSLALTAPYACQYAPPIFAKMPMAMAVVFMGSLVFATVRRLGMVKSVVNMKEQAKKEIVRAEQEDLTAKTVYSIEAVPKKDSQGFPVG